MELASARMGITTAVECAAAMVNTAMMVYAHATTNAMETRYVRTYPLMIIIVAIAA
jgi:hypothetical protein